jgi:mannose/cellobiose epimerase-like protein (N-acyl-D-glucosamine 2-epimerase family)
MSKAEPTGFRPLQRHDLEPELQPTTADVIEAITEALDAAVELAEPQQTAARCLTILTRMQAASNGHIDANELLTALRRLVADWQS